MIEPIPREVLEQIERDAVPSGTCQNPVMDIRLWDDFGDTDMSISMVRVRDLARYCLALMDGLGDCVRGHEPDSMGYYDSEIEEARRLLGKTDA